MAASCLLSLIGVAAPAVAADDSASFEITPFVGYRLGGQFDFEDPANPDGDERSVDLSDDASFGIDLGVYRDSTSFYELLYGQQTAELDTSEPTLQGVDVKVEYLHFGGTLLFPQDEVFVPYLSMTIGATRLDAQSGGYDSETEFSASLGGGLRFAITQQFFITTGLRGYVTFVDSDTSIFCTGEGDLNCLLKTSGSTFFQGEASLGVTFAF
jgi:hypothetical protein